MKLIYIILLLMVSSSTLLAGDLTCKILISDSIVQANDKVVVWLTGANITPSSSARDTFEIIQREMEFSPHILIVKRGDTVSFPNEDPLYHNVFSLSEAKKFDLGRYASGETDYVTFDKNGIVRLFCEIHSDMSAVILVMDNDYYAESSTNEGFTIADIPEGKYDLHIWHEGLGERKISVSIADTKDNYVEVNL